MKKYICLILAALLACLGMTAVAEETAKKEAVYEAFSKTWISEDSDGYTVEIQFDDEEGTYDVFGYREVSDDEDYSFEFEKCYYDSQEKALICEGGELYHDKAGKTEDEDIEEVAASGFGAKLTIDENYRMHWTGSGEAIPEQVYDNLDNDLFVGEWVSGNTEIYIDKIGQAYYVYIIREDSEIKETYWDCKCSADDGAGTLSGVITGKGTKSTDTFNEELEQYEGEIQNVEGDATFSVYDSFDSYTDGAVTFRRDGDAMLWEDATENAGEGMRFERAPEEDEEI